MKISGFTFVKKASKLYIPVRPSIESVLPVVDEFIVVMGDNDPDDNTEDILRSINSPKIQMHHSVWDREKYKKTMIFAQQTDIAKDLCTGDWLFYIQADEVLHEKYHAPVLNAINKYDKDSRVEGFLFQYRHFWGDYWHYFDSYAWYPREIRVIRNDKDIHSWRDAQSFRKYSCFSYSMEDYTGKRNSRKLFVIELDAEIYHYGGCRPPEKMTSKRKGRLSDKHRDDKDKARRVISRLGDTFDYGPLDRLKTFKGTHPAVMTGWINDFHWKDQLQYSGKISKDRQKFKHEKLKYRLMTPLSKLSFLRDRVGFKNYKKISI